MSHAKKKANFRPLIAASALIGFGMGGIFERFVFAQMLQINTVVSGKALPNTLLKAQESFFWDGVSQAVAWTIVLAGIMGLWSAFLKRDIPKSTRTFLGSLAVGWGLYNVLEGLLFHHLLQYHHIYQRAYFVERLYWDGVYLAAGFAMIVLGNILVRDAKRDWESRTYRKKFENLGHQFYQQQEG